MVRQLFKWGFLLLSMIASVSACDFPGAHPLLLVARKAAGQRRSINEKPGLISGSSLESAVL